MLATESGIINGPISSLQLEKADRPTLATLLPIVRLFRFLQPSNAKSPIHVTPLPIVTLVRPLQF